MSARRRSPRALVLAALALAALAGCSAARPPARAAVTGPALVGLEESGQASWYGEPYHGRRSASGEVYDMNQMVAAHRTLPFGTWLLVENRDNGRTVEVRIIDRGPFKDDRILDVSRAAVVALGGTGTGTFPVRTRVIAGPSGSARASAVPASRAAGGPAPAAAPGATSAPGAATAAQPSSPAAAPAVAAPSAPASTVAKATVPNSAAAPGAYSVQVGAFTEQARAEVLRAALEREGRTAAVVRVDGAGPAYRVRVGSFASRAAAEEEARRLSRAGYAVIVTPP